ncbi:hypothetical protein [Halosegnis longus]|uniref:hypothetical protein n=1 Tax=Halosegnis longus TaxID=2216012 RepID=UPI0013141BDC|nr:hypothetical protein [Salella cibi]
MSHGRTRPEQPRESNREERPQQGGLRGLAGRVKRHIVEWPDRCVETQISALDQR